MLVFSILRWNFVPDLPLRYESFASFCTSWGFRATILFFPPLMLLVYYLSGIYINTSNKSRLDLLPRTLAAAAIGALIYFLVVLLNDIMPMRRLNYELILMMFATLSVIVYAGRFTLATILKCIRGSRLNPYSLITSLGSDIEQDSDLHRSARQAGFEITRVFSVDPDKKTPFDVSALRRLVSEKKCAGVLLTPSEFDAKTLLRMLHPLYTLGVPVMVTPDDRNMMLGGVVKFVDVISNPFIDITRSDLPSTTVAIKRFFDVVLGGIGLILTSPVILAFGIAVKWQSEGPMFYTQERIGYRRKPFYIWKLRSMTAKAETSGPMLTSDNDTRITPVGRIMRKYRIDELPNLWNVVKGDMSLVGPRPEREFFIRQIIKEAPHYTLLHQVRPGLTSWGMVRYGYASNVRQMVERLKFDILYIQNLSLTLDMRILFHTVRTVVHGEGK